MSTMASQITGVSIVYSIVGKGPDQRKHQSSTSLASVRKIHRWPVNSSHKRPVTRKMFPFEDVVIGQNSRDLDSILSVSDDICLRKIQRIYVCAVSIVSADDLVPLGAKPSKPALLTKFLYSIWKGSVLEKLSHIFKDKNGVYIKYQNTRNIFWNIHPSFQEIQIAVCDVIKEYSASFPSEASTGKPFNSWGVTHDDGFYSC